MLKPKIIVQLVRGVGPRIKVGRHFNPKFLPKRKICVPIENLSTWVTLISIFGTNDKTEYIFSIQSNDATNCRYEAIQN